MTKSQGTRLRARRVDRRTSKQLRRSRSRPQDGARSARRCRNRRAIRSRAPSQSTGVTEPSSSSLARRSISATQASAAPSSAGPSRLHNNSWASFARSSAGRARHAERTSSGFMKEGYPDDSHLPITHTQVAYREVNEELARMRYEVSGTGPYNHSATSSGFSFTVLTRSTEKPRTFPCSSTFSIT